MLTRYRKQITLERALAYLLIFAGGYWAGLLTVMAMVKPW
jgi:hypothetical protein